MCVYKNLPGHIFLLKPKLDSTTYIPLKVHTRIHARFLNHTFNYGGSLVCDSFFSFLKFLPGKRTKNFISLLLTLYAPASDSRYDFIATRFVLFGKISSIFFGCFENVLAISQQSYQSLVVVGGEIIPVVHFLAFGP